MEEPVLLPEIPTDRIDHGLSRASPRFVPIPKNAVKKHEDLHRRLDAFAEWVENSPFNTMSGSGEQGIITAGYAYRKVLDSLGKNIPADLSLLKTVILFLPSGPAASPALFQPPSMRRGRDLAS